jgi:phage terminase Nu1 subunit (DNA packaging protein)
MTTQPGVEIDVLCKVLDGLTERRVQQLVKEGVVIKLARGRYDLLKSVRGYIRYLNSLRRGAPDEIKGIDEAKLRKTAAEAEMAELDLARQRGLLVDAASVQKAWGSILAEARKNLLSVPAKVAPLLPGLDAVECEQIIRDQIDQALDTFSRSQVELDSAAPGDEAGNDQDEQPAAG